jgi:RimJ/RimL family protein N-acetyltransferase
VSTEPIPAELETDRLLLRRWATADAEPFGVINAAPEVMQHIGDPLTRGQSDAFLARIQNQFDIVGYGLGAVGWAARSGRLVPEVSGSWRRAA